MACSYATLDWKECQEMTIWGTERSERVTFPLKKKRQDKGGRKYYTHQQWNDQQSQFILKFHSQNPSYDCFIKCPINAREGAGREGFWNLIKLIFFMSNSEQKKGGGDYSSQVIYIN